MAAETETTLWGQVTRGTSSHRGKDLTDTWTDDVLPTSEKKVDFSCEIFFVKNLRHNT